MSARANCRLKGIQVFFFFQMVVEFLVGLVFPCDTRPIPSSGDSKHAYSECIQSDTGNKNTHIWTHEHTRQTDCTATTHTTKKGQSAWMKD